MPAIPGLDSCDVGGRRVLVRADLNVPFHEGQIEDTMRIERVAPTIRELIDKGARVIIASHLGRPHGVVDTSLSLRPVAPALAAALGGRPVSFAEDCVGPVAQKAVAALADGEVALLENLRFHPGEEANDEAFAGALAELADLYVNDAFSCAHRAHASVVAITRRLPAVAGRGLEAELAALDRALDHPARPLVALIGGAKVSTKLTALEHLVDRVDVMVIGGAMANTFLAARGLGIGRSLYEPDLVDVARHIIERADGTGCPVVLPEDVVVATALVADTPHQTVSADAVADEDMILDIGPATVATIIRHLKKARTLVWNGPLGAFETDPFDRGTQAVGDAVADLTAEGKLDSIAGGGDTVAALMNAGAGARLTYLSTAGGAFLEWLEGKALPGIEALKT